MIKQAGIELTLKSALYLVEVLNGLYPDTYEINPRLEGGSFDLDMNGEEYDGGSYTVDEDGTISIVSIFNLPIGDEVVGNGIDTDVYYTKRAYEKLDRR